jgi:hypothetical protein
MGTTLSRGLKDICGTVLRKAPPTGKKGRSPTPESLRGNLSKNVTDLTIFSLPSCPFTGAGGTEGLPHKVGTTIIINKTKTDLRHGNN